MIASLLSRFYLGLVCWFQRTGCRVELAGLSLELTSFMHITKGQEQIPDAKPSLVLSTRAGCSVQPGQQVALSHTSSWSLPPSSSQDPHPGHWLVARGGTETFLVLPSKK